MNCEGRRYSLKRGSLLSACAKNNRGGGTQQNRDIHPGRPVACVLEIQADHIVELYRAAAVYLPQTGDSRLRFQQTAAMPDVIFFDFVLDWRTRSNQRHFAFQHVEELR